MFEISQFSNTSRALALNQYSVCSKSVRNRHEVGSIDHLSSKSGHKMVSSKSSAGSSLQRLNVGWTSPGL